MLTLSETTWHNTHTHLHTITSTPTFLHSVFFPKTEVIKLCVYRIFRSMFVSEEARKNPYVRKLLQGYLDGREQDEGMVVPRPLPSAAVPGPGPGPVGPVGPVGPMGIRTVTVGPLSTGALVEQVGGLRSREIAVALVTLRLKDLATCIAFDMSRSPNLKGRRSEHRTQGVPPHDRWLSMVKHG